MKKERITTRFYPGGLRVTTYADALAFERRVRILRALCLLALVAYSVGVTVKLIAARHEVRILRGEIAP